MTEIDQCFFIVIVLLANFIIHFLHPYKPVNLDVVMQRRSSESKFNVDYLLTLTSGVLERNRQTINVVKLGLSA
jgi:hypothetical protein